MTKRNIRGWVIQCALEDKKPSAAILEKPVAMAKEDDSTFVSIPSPAPPALPLDQRWDLFATALVSHEADKDDHNLPLYWYGIEPLAEGEGPRQLAKAKIPLIRQYIARRSASK